MVLLLMVGGAAASLALGKLVLAGALVAVAALAGGRWEWKS